LFILAKVHQLLYSLTICRPLVVDVGKEEVKPCDEIIALQTFLCTPFDSLKAAKGASMFKMFDNAKIDVIDSTFAEDGTVEFLQKQKNSCSFLCTCPFFVE
jgi:hypothetical protein